jgi:hypothetical protein
MLKTPVIKARSRASFARPELNPENLLGKGPEKKRQ